MPIVDVQIVAPVANAASSGLASELANALAAVFKAQPSTVWLRLQHLDSKQYAENAALEPPHPVFLRVLLADLPPPQVLAVQAAALASAVAAVLGRSSSHVHVEYAPPGRGRVAFGGKLLQ